MNKTLEMIFADFMQNTEIEDGENVRNANERVINYIGSLNVTDKNNVNDLITGLGYEYEKQGFVNGFRYALQMANA